MTCLFHAIASLGTWAAAACFTLGHAETAMDNLAPVEHQPSPRHPPVVLVFDTLANGSTVHVTNIDLTYTLRSSRAGRSLTHEEVKVLRDDGVSMCFEPTGPFEQQASCAPLIVTTISIDRPLPGTWHTVTATLKNDATTTAIATAGLEVPRQTEGRTASKYETARWEDAGDSVTVFVGMKGVSSVPMTPMCGESACLDNSDMRSAYFDRIYRDRHWGPTRSGPGSTISATVGVRLAVEEVLRSYGVTNMLDAPCGDLTWMPLVHGIDQVRYTGADISATVVEENRRKFHGNGEPGERYWGGEGEDAATTAGGAGVSTKAGGLAGAVFVQADLVEGVPPSVDGKPYDLVFVRDVMLHLPPRHNLKILRNIEASGAHLFMASTYLDGNDNWDSDTFVPAKGHFINLALPPYCLRAPVALFNDASTARADQRMGLWELDPSRPLVASNEDCSRVAWD